MLELHWKGQTKVWIHEQGFFLSQYAQTHPQPVDLVVLLNTFFVLD